MRVNEIFYSLQGEGRFTGTPAIFLRLSGCNLKCDFCDTDHSEAYLMDAEQIVEALSEYPSKHIVITGGEPSLQLDYDFINYLHQYGYFVQVETNGTRPLPENVDWVTCSPKYQPIVYGEVDELKVVFTGEGDNERLSKLGRVMAQEYYLQPCDVKDKTKNAQILAECITYLKANPKWKLSLQTQKIIDVR